MTIDMQETAKRYLTDLTSVMTRFDTAAFEAVMALILDAYQREAQIFTMGNGGSGSTASHFACDINKGCCLDLDRKFKMLCLNDSLPTMLAYANDISYDAVFVEQLKNFFRPGDLVIGISGSGNSENVLRAVRYAKENDGRTVGLAGFDGGKLAAAVDVPLVADVHDMQMVEDMHMIVVHMIMQAIYRSLHGGEMAGAC